MTDSQSEKLETQLSHLGFNEWFQKKISEAQDSAYRLARVTAVNKDNYLIRNQKCEVLAEVTGKLLYSAESSLTFPVVGDWVQVQYFDDESFAIIHQILPRRSLLKRKVAGKKIEYQPIAANIDTAFIMQSLDFNFNLPRLERYLVMVNESHIQPVVVLSKRDLISKEKLIQNISEIKNLYQHYNIIAFSNNTGEGLDEIRKSIKKGHTYCLLGSSGVGKTTLLNNLIGENIYRTSTVREKDGRGRHITARRQMIILEQGGLIIDTPGMREMGNIDVKEGINDTFKDIITLSQNCRFKNCTHLNEPGCSVIKAVESGKLMAEHYQNYLKIRKESEYHEMSYLEKRKKDKAFGKFCKQAIKTIKKK
jgi:ribosome biogenesis GTPase